MYSQYEMHKPCTLSTLHVEELDGGASLAKCMLDS